MIAYNKDWLDAMHVNDVAGQWHKRKWLSEETWKAIQQKYTVGFYIPNVFVRIGLALFSFILIMAAMGLVGLVGFPDSETGVAAYSIVFGLVWIAILEFRVIDSGRHFRSGIDDMLLYVSTGCLITGFGFLMPSNSDILIYYIVALPLLTFFSLRYIDRLMTFAAYWCALGVIFLTLKDIPKIAIYLLPFAGMMFSAGVYFYSRKGQKRYEYRHWHGLLVMLEMLAILTFYASGNFWVIQQAGDAFFQIEQVPLAWFFWAFTFLVPLAYVYWGYRHKERLLMDLGLGCIALAVFTFRFYHHVMPLAWAAVIAGAILFAGAYFSIRYLRQHRGAYTYDEDERSLLQEFEEQLIEQTIANQPTKKPSPTEKFGGGDFGGSGAEGTF